MEYSASFTDARVNFTQPTEFAMKEKAPVTVPKHSKPVFRTAPVDAPQSPTTAYLSAADDLMDEYSDIFEALAK